ncbi:MAG: acetolactate synthase large subunit [Candidatus Thiodiazotropha sp. (ex Lucina aurantia)]|uniref:Acetolactate synthase n=2 Tax=Candidatus Thiodiazotropha TaxID=1913444 RepID=A0A7Z0VLR8_9GAMM|nr:acetolactate synthase large subunit [Candidatus Thiodiazotropha endolucinida]MBT3010488.1 acetolactate synthase large subunit [Candidatus Thiodiazotropha sp. (ex Lucina pensylvanica)]MBT3016239.1 acetolactate synthase large subunit [Candidatus Thiodiazotropha taylori]MBV2097391.1 acetolactate synthase large subunit [Candidatus Thiodiazotropha sp. (ex Codakia orbicularis)]MBV2102235.1 acetolactate synthase large subunit [Candidatus Thiodiazotropha sp. (ex Lucina aurantia)]MBT3022168.1 acetol
MKASGLMVKCLENEGIEYVFGVPGEENADFMMSLEQSDKIKFILTRHEQGAAFMAEIYGRLSGNPAVCLGTLGPGATNLITGVADANMDRAPVLVLTGQGSTARLHKESHQIMDVVEMFKPVTKWATSIYNAVTIPEVVRKAVRIARTEKPGAVHIELPEDIAKHQVSAEPLDPRRFRRSVVDDKILDQSFDLITHAKRPVIIAGNGAIRRRAAKQLRLFCEKTGIGVLSTFMAKGAVDMDADYCLYTIGLGSKDYPTLAIDEADLVITLGFDMVEYHPRLWNPHKNKPIIHADFLPAEIDEYYHPQVELVGDLAHTLWMLNQRLTTHGIPKYVLAQQAETRRLMQNELAEHANDDTSGTIRPQKMLWDIRQVMGPEDILLSDVGAHKMWIARHYHCHQPNTCLIPNGFCSMGFALPGAIAASLVAPQRRILGISGDAGFLMNVQEMETAKRLHSNLVMLIWEDHAYGLIAWKQESEFGRHTDLSFDNPDWMQLAGAFGWHGHRVEQSTQFADTLETAFRQQGPSLIVVPVDYSENMALTRRLGEMTEPCPVAS